MSSKLQNMHGRIVMFGVAGLAWCVYDHYVIEIITSIKSLMALSLIKWMIIIWRVFMNISDTIISYFPR
jgi:hypothetical protein